MTTELSWSWSVGLALLGLACGAGVSNRTADQLDTSGYPPDIREAYEVFAVRCSRCHSLARPLGARIRDRRHWERYVARMRMQPGSGINPKNADAILKFLFFYTDQLRQEESGAPVREPMSSPASDEGQSAFEGAAAPASNSADDAPQEPADAPLDGDSAEPESTGVTP